MSFHLFHINELYSNASGTVQFIELVGAANGQNLTTGHTITVVQGATTHTFTMPSNLPSAVTLNKPVLFATQGFADLGLVTPDFIIPDGFLFTNGGTVIYPADLLTSDFLTYASLPTNGTLSLGPLGVIATNSPSNFAGATGTIPGNPILGTAGADNITGTAANEYLAGLGGNDTLNGGAGPDTMAGGLGNDTYVVDSTLDVVKEALNAGIDLVQSTATHTLSANVEDLTLLGAGNINGTGNTLNNALTGNGGNNVLNGSTGADTMAGGLGNDTYVVDSALDVVTEGLSAGTDLVQSTVTHTLSANVENLTLTGAANLNGTGNTLDNVLTGNGGSNVLNGSAGADTMNGGLGNDTYVVDSTLDVVTEALNGGTDLVQSTAPAYTLSANVENLTLLGAANIDGSGNTLNNVLAGNSGNNVLNGDSGTDTVTYAGAAAGVTVNLGLAVAQDTIGAGTDTLSLIENLTGSGFGDTLTGDAGANILDGGAGADTMAGDLGDDTYIVNSTLDVVTEALDAGIDLVQSTATRTLSANVENLTLLGAANINGTGNALDNVLTGNSGNNVLNGGAGADTMAGGLGNDTYVVDNAGDTVTEGLAGGTDSVQSSISYALGAELENLTLTGAAAINGTGNTLANTVTGNAGSNVLDGAAGVDTLSYLNATAGVSISLALAVAQITGGAGTDTVLNFENITGSNFNDTLTGSAGVNLIVGGLGNDTMDGGAGVDTASYASSASAVVANLATGAVTGGAGSDTLLNIENLTGSNFNDTLTGSAGVNVLDGGAGIDTMAGGAGNDTYVVDNAADLVTENLAEGTDLVQSGVSYTLAANVERLTLTGTDAIDGTGNDLANIITGNAAANVLDGGAGADSLVGGAGDDTYVVDEAGDTITEALAAGTDTVQSSITLTLGANLENLSLTGVTAINATGNTLANTISGNAGDNVLEGGAGVDTVSYANATAGVSVSLALATAQITGGAGTDTVLNFENLTGSVFDDVLTGNAAANVITGGLGNDTIDGGLGVDTASYATATLAVVADLVTGTATGGAGSDTLVGIENLTGSDFNDTLTGNTGANVLTGGAGADTMAGGLGNDTYVVDNAGDIVTEGNAAGGDSVQSSLNYTLGANLENLTLTGTAAINGTGNTLANTVTGNAGNNVLNGGTGVDTVSYASATAGVSVSLASAAAQVTGGAGTDTVLNFENLTGSNFNDTLTGNAAANVLIGGLGNDAMDGGAGDDTASYASATVAVVADLASGTATGGAGSDTLVSIENLTGSNLNDTLTGNAGVNVLAGGAGSDSLTGGAGADRFVFDSKAGTDSVSDFVSGADQFAISQAVIRIGDGDTVIDAAATVAGPGGFASTAELVIVTGDIAGAIDATSAAAAIGSAAAAYGLGNTRLFAVDNGTQSALFLFTSSAADALVSAAELTLLGVATSTPATVLGDYLFVA